MSVNPFNPFFSGVSGLKRRVKMILICEKEFGFGFGFGFNWQSEIKTIRNEYEYEIN